MKKLSIIAGMLLIATSASAQFANSNATKNTISTQGANESYNRFEISFNPTMVALDDYEIDGEDELTLNGFTVGYLRGISLSKNIPLFLEVGGRINYAWWSETEEGEYNDYDVELKQTISYLNISVPVNIAYKIAFQNSNISVTPYTGLALKANLLGNYTVKAEVSDGYDSEDEEETSSFFDKDEVGKDLLWDRVQLGWNIGAGVNFNKFYLGFNYGVDLTGLAKKISSSNYAVTLGYTF